MAFGYAVYFAEPDRNRVIRWDPDAGTAAVAAGEPTPADPSQTLNKPYGLAQFTVAKSLFPHGHPYSWPTIGEVEDLHAASVDDAREFFGRYYHPGNASLVVAGDIGARDAFAMVEELFGEIPAGPPVARVEPPPANVL